MKICYTPKKFTGSSKMTIIKANEIIEAYKEQGFSLTLRQLYYQFVARDIIPNSLNEYKKLGSVINDARLAGLIDWSAIEDRTRFIREQAHWDQPEDILRTAARQFTMNKREGQEYYIEVWIEKDALVGLLDDVCTQFDVPYFSCRGYTSQSEMWEAAQRFLKVTDYGRSKTIQCKILHLGDHDPSGLDMTRDISERMNLFYNFHNSGFNEIEVNRIALNIDQVEQYDPPPNPAKSTDVRFKKYADEFGYESWELDALEPSVIVDLVKMNIINLTDSKKFQKKIKEIEKHKENLHNIVDNYEMIQTYANDLADRE